MSGLDTLIFVTGHLLGAFVLPPLSLVLIAGVGLALSFRRPLAGRFLMALGLAGIVLSSTPLVANRLVGLIETPCTPVTSGAADAIVILGGGMRRESPEYGPGPNLRSSALERVRYAARVHRQTGAPVLVTGGSPKQWPAAEAGIMREALEQDYGVPVTWVEDQSRTTRENAVLSARFLHDAGIKRIYLISHAWHLTRAIPEFEREGFVVVPAGTSCDGIQPFGWSDLIPQPQALVVSHNAAHEALGLVWYQLIHWLK